MTGALRAAGILALPGALCALAGEPPVPVEKPEDDAVAPYAHVTAAFIESHTRPTDGTASKTQNFFGGACALGVALRTGETGFHTVDLQSGAADGEDSLPTRSAEYTVVPVILSYNYALRTPLEGGPITRSYAYAGVSAGTMVVTLDAAFRAGGGESRSSDTAAPLAAGAGGGVYLSVEDKVGVLLGYRWLRLQSHEFGLSAFGNPLTARFAAQDVHIAQAGLIFRF